MATQTQKTKTTSTSGEEGSAEANNDITRLHSQMIQALSEEVAPGVGNSWDQFKNCMAPYLTVSTLAECKSMFHIIPALMTNGEMAYGEYEILSNAFNDMKHHTCERIVGRFTRLIQQKQKELDQKILRSGVDSSGQDKVITQDETRLKQVLYGQDRSTSLLSVNTLWIVVLLMAISMSYYNYLSTVKNLEEKLENLQQKYDEHFMSKQEMPERYCHTDKTVCNEGIEMKVKPLREKLQYLQQKYEEFAKSKTDPTNINREFMESIKGEVMKEIKPIQEEIQSFHQARDGYLKTENDILEANDKIMAKLEGVLKSSKKIAFSAYAGRDLKNLRLHDIIVFDSIIINIGKSYDSNTGIFRCPKEGDGLYFITATTFSFPNDEIETEIVRNGENIPVKIYAGAPEYRHNQGTNSAVVLLMAGDQLYVRVNFIYPKKKASGVQLRNIWSIFTAFRIN